MRQTHTPGKKLFVDYAGITVSITDRGTGEIREAAIFTAAMGASSYTYCEATWSQSSPIGSAAMCAPSSTWTQPRPPLCPTTSRAASSSLLLRPGAQSD